MGTKRRSKHKPPANRIGNSSRQNMCHYLTNVKRHLNCDLCEFYNSAIPHFNQSLLLTQGLFQSEYAVQERQAHRAREARYGATTLQYSELRTWMYSGACVRAIASTWQRHAAKASLLGQRHASTIVIGGWSTLNPCYKATNTQRRPVCDTWRKCCSSRPQSWPMRYFKARVESVKGTICVDRVTYKHKPVETYCETTVAKRWSFCDPFGGCTNETTIRLTQNDSLRDWEVHAITHLFQIDRRAMSVKFWHWWRLQRHVTALRVNIPVANWTR